MTAPSLYLDDDASAGPFLSQLREFCPRVVRAHEVGLSGAADETHLTFAGGEGLVLVSYNVGDFQRLHWEFVVRGQPHAGILLLQQQRRTIRDELRLIRAFIQSRSAEEMRSQLEYISAFDHEQAGTQL